MSLQLPALRRQLERCCHLNDPTSSSSRVVERKTVECFCRRRPSEGFGGVVSQRQKCSVLTTAESAKSSGGEEVCERCGGGGCLREKDDFFRRPLNKTRRVAVLPCGETPAVGAPALAILALVHCLSNTTSRVRQRPASRGEGALETCMREGGASDSVQALAAGVVDAGFLQLGTQLLFRHPWSSLLHFSVRCVEKLRFVPQQRMRIQTRRGCRLRVLSLLAQRFDSHSPSARKGDKRAFGVTETDRTSRSNRRSLQVGNAKLFLKETPVCEAMRTLGRNSKESSVLSSAKTRRSL